MAGSLVQRISLDGGEVVRDTLMQLGTAGMEAFQKIRAASMAATEAGKNAAEATKNAAEQLTGFSEVGKGAEASLKGLEEQGKSLLKTFGLLGASLSATFAGLSKLALDTASKIKDVYRTSDTLGVTIEQFQGLGLAFRKAGVEQEGLLGIMGRFNSALEKAKDSDKEQSGVLGQLGVSLKDIAEKTDNTAERLELFAKALKNSGATAAQIMAALRETFGRTGAELKPVMDALAKEGLGGLEAEAKRLGIVWDHQERQLSDNLKRAWRELGDSVTNVKDRLGLMVMPSLTVYLDKLNETLSAGKDSFLAFAKAVGESALPVVQQITAIISTGVTTAFKVATAAIAPFVSAFNAVFGAQWDAKAVLIVLAITKVTGGFNLLLSTLGMLPAIIETIAGAFMTLWANPMIIAVGALVVAFYALYQNWDTIKKYFDSSFAPIAKFFGDAWKGALIVVSEAFDGWKWAVGSIFDWVADKVKSVLDLVKSLASAIGLTSSAASGSSGSSDNPSGLAGGGHVFGPGTSTSDSILARLSNGEFVQRAAAVRHYGSSFMERVNSLQFPVQAALRFATGGFVGPAPVHAALPESVASNALRPFNLQIGADHFNGLLAPQTVAEKLVQFASNKSTRSMGSKPSWY